jgi:hypothetical protein
MPEPVTPTVSAGQIAAWYRQFAEAGQVLNRVFEVLDQHGERALAESLAQTVGVPTPEIVEPEPEAEAAA